MYIVTEVMQSIFLLCMLVFGFICFAVWAGR